MSARERMPPATITGVLASMPAARKSARVSGTLRSKSKRGSWTSSTLAAPKCPPAKAGCSSTIAFGTRHLDASERHEGMVAAIAFESLVKLIAFLAVGAFVTFGMFHGFGDLFTHALNSARIASGEISRTGCPRSRVKRFRK